ncbi:MAG: hypothetical protein Q9167_003169 [Letrouitia subvulpina]
MIQPPCKRQKVGGFGDVTGVAAPFQRKNLWLATVLCDTPDSGNLSLTPPDQEISGSRTVPCSGVGKTTIKHSLLPNIPICDLEEQSLDKQPTRVVRGDGFAEEILLYTVSGVKLGNIDSQWSALYRALDQKDVELQLLVVPSVKSTNPGRKPKAPAANATLAIVLYSTQEMSESIEKLLSRCRLYLQLPTNCDRNVPYLNPQSLSTTETPIRITGNLHPRGHDIEILEDGSDPSSVLENQKKYPECHPPPNIKSDLYSHQRQALSFMLAREKGWDYHSDDHDLYKAEETSEGTKYLDIVTRKIQSRPPDEFRGGILADCMGLGKTLTMISLLSSPNSHRTSDGCLQGRNLDVVITTYDVVAAQWRNQHKRQSTLFSIRWQRVILDEAHEIRKSTTDKAKAVCALHSDIRWVVTGTPLHNGLQDLASLLLFLRVYPDMDATRLRALLKTLTNESRTMDLISPLCLRRSRKVIELSKRSDKIHGVILSPAEINAYYSAKAATVQLLHNEALDSNLRRYANILAEINSLRQICNIGQYYRGPSRSRKLQPMTSEQAIQKTFEELQAADMAYCTICKETVKLMTSGDDLEVGEGISNVPRMSLCGQLVCATCASSILSLDLNCQCGKGMICDFSPITSSSVARLSFDEDTLMELPAKIQALRGDVLEVPREDKSVIFSFWTTTLDLVEVALQDTGTKVVRIDGSVSPQKRSEILIQFKEDPDIRALLMALGCGSTGLNLVMANHVFLMEPQWNPMIEAQALDRVYRQAIGSGECAN